MSTAVAARRATPQQFLEDPNKFLEIKRALPKGIDAERIRRISLTELRKNPTLDAAASGNPLSFFGAVIQAAQLGLEPGSGLGHCYLIPYKGEVTFQLGYQGMLELIYRSGKVSSIETDTVVESDDFFYARTQDGLQFRHTPDWDIDARDESNIKLVYAMAKMKDGGTVIAVMTKAQIQANELKMRKGKPGSDGHPAQSAVWRDHWEQMARKTVLRRLYKMLPKSVELSDLLNDDDDDVKTDMGKIARDAGITIDAATGKEIPRTGASAADIPLHERMAMQEEEQ